MSQRWRTLIFSWKWTLSLLFPFHKCGTDLTWSDVMNINRSEKPIIQRVIGQTKTSGFQIGARRTFLVSVPDAWNFLISEQGQSIWLGEPCQLQLTEGATFTTPSGTKGVVRVVNPEVNLRLTWQPPEWHQSSTIQIRTIKSGANTVISFHQEGLPGASERVSRRAHWQQVLATLQTFLPSNEL
jgi:activator of HSP90 ATPase